MSGPVAGVDEVGRGPLAGPVVAAAVILRHPIEGLADSKALSARRREQLSEEILATAHVAVAACSVDVIERINILQASLQAMRAALFRLEMEPALVMVDGNRTPDLPWPSRCVIGGDALIPEISAASIVAKVLRDRLMARLAVRYPQYGFERNAGYGTVQHRRALVEHGATPHHRRDFAPVRAVLSRPG
ncbi:MAG: ribonuclease HII [Geminicoccaceae bacterium]